MKKFFATLALLYVGFLSFAQIQQPVHWEFSTEKISDTEYELVFKASIDKNWHLYAQHLPPENFSLPTRFEFEEVNGAKLIDSVRPFTKLHEAFEELAGAMSYYYEESAVFKQRIQLTGSTAKIVGLIDYMSCDDSQCVKLDEDFEFNVTGKKVAKPVKATVETQQANANVAADAPEQTTKEEDVPSEPAETAETQVHAEQTVVTESLSQDSPAEEKEASAGSLWAIIIEAILWGFAALLTPCVFPMVPMTVSFFMKGSENKSKGKVLAGTYGISIVALYTIPIAAIIFITYFLGGESVTADIFNWLSTHWIPNVLFFLIFMIFAASFFGAFEIVLPSKLVNRADAKADRGGLMGAFFMALTLVLVSFSCTGPIVGTIIVKSTQGEIWEPIVTMFAFSAAFALPFTLFAFFPAWLNKLPKSGGWLNSVKVVLGFIEVALGLKFLSIADQTYHWGILDREVYLAVWIVTFTLLGFYLLGKLKLAHDSDVKFVSVPRLAMAIIVFSFVVYLIPGMWGAPLKALSGYLPPQSTMDFDVERIVRENQGGGTAVAGHDANKGLCEKPKYADILHIPHGIDGYFDYEQALACAKEQNKPLFIDFTGHGCVNCREMEARVWSDKAVMQRLKEDYIVVALYVDDKTKLPESEWVQSSYDGKWKKTIGKKNADYQIARFQMNAQPYYCLLDTNGDLLIDPKAYDLNIESFVDFLDKGLEEFSRR